MYFPKVVMQSDRVYQEILNEMCRNNKYGCGRDCDNCIVNNHVEGAKWLRSMGIRINVIWHGSVLPNRLSQWLISRQIKSSYRGYVPPFLVVYSMLLTAITVVGILHHFILPIPK